MTCDRERGIDNQLINGEYFSYARKGLNTLMRGSQGEGFLTRVTT